MSDKSAEVQGELLIHLDLVVRVLLPLEVTEEMEEEGTDKKIASFRNTFIKHFGKMEDSIKTHWRYLNWWLD